MGFDLDCGIRGTVYNQTTFHHLLFLLWGFCAKHMRRRQT